MSNGKWATCHFGESYKVRWEKEGAERSRMRKTTLPLNKEFEEHDVTLFCVVYILLHPD